MGRGITDLREHTLGDRWTISGLQIEAMTRQLKGFGGRKFATIERDLLLSMLQEIRDQRLQAITNIPYRPIYQKIATSEPPS